MKRQVKINRLHELGVHVDESASNLHIDKLLENAKSLQVLPLGRFKPLPPICTVKDNPIARPVAESPLRKVRGYAKL